MPQERPSGVPIGDVFRRRRAEVLKKGLREMARELNIAPSSNPTLPIAA